MKYFKFSKVLGAVASLLFLFCTCHASAMDPKQKAGTDNHGQEDLEKKYIDMVSERYICLLALECRRQAEPIQGVLEKKIDKIVIEESAKQELVRLGVKNLGSIPVNVLVYNFGIVAPAEKYLRLGYGSIVPDGYIQIIRKNIKSCNSIKLLNHPTEGIVLACDDVAIVVRKQNVTVTVFGFTRTETAFRLEKVKCNS